MELPKIDLSTLPDLDTVTALFGTLGDLTRTQGSDDSIIILMTFLHQVV